MPLYMMLLLAEWPLKIPAIYIKSRVSKKYYYLLFISALCGLTQIQVWALYTEISYQSASIVDNIFLTFLSPAPGRVQILGWAISFCPLSRCFDKFNSVSPDRLMLY